MSDAGSPTRVLPGPVGMIGLGHMGAALAANLAGAGFDVLGHDLAGSHRAPAGVRFTADPDEVARHGPVLVLSLPDGRAGEQVARRLATTPQRRVEHVLDTTTTGVIAAGVIARLLADNGIGYVDAPVSGGIAGARARTLMVMYAGSGPDCAAVAPVIAGLSDRSRRVGDTPGQAQAVKLANNFLSATALAATSEAVAFATACGVDAACLLEVINGSSGRNNATEQKFPEHVLTGRYAAGFANTLMAKDVRLFLDEARARGGSVAAAEVIADLWMRFAQHHPGTDFTGIHPYLNPRTTAAQEA